MVTGDEERWANLASLRLFNIPLAALIEDFDKAKGGMEPETLASLIALGREIEAADASRALGEDFETTKGGLSEETVTSPMEAGLGSEVVDASRPQRGRMTRFQTWVVGVHSLLPGFVRVRRQARKETCSKGTTSHVIIPSLFLLIGVVWLFQALTPAWGLVPGEWSPARILLDAVPCRTERARTSCGLRPSSFLFLLGRNQEFLILRTLYGRVGSPISGLARKGETSGTKSLGSMTPFTAKRWSDDRGQRICNWLSNDCLQEAL